MRYVVFFLLLALAPAMVRAHASLDRAEPRAGGTVAAAPSEVKLWFTDKLEQSFSRIEVRDAKGARVDNGKTTVDGSNRSLLRVPLRALEPGTYKVFWRVMSVDTHRAEG